MKGIWKNLCPKLNDGFEGFDYLREGLQKETDEIINIAKEMNFEIPPEDVNKALWVDNDNITNDDLL
ncbi:Hypothetical predicted protein [Octopus vulgaris]|uniref:Uncharacterized protein n=1 Tax=Octopus vulgaris TaxID=6645 RepID=A0AA36C0F7_OCTVU|nr:Hypothetical predicted protein [Octopus vulgaris]